MRELAALELICMAKWVQTFPFETKPINNEYYAASFRFWPIFLIHKSPSV